MTWLDHIRARVFRPGDTLENSDRRALLFGAAVTSAGLLVPKSIVSIAKPPSPDNMVVWVTAGATYHFVGNAEPCYTSINEAIGAVRSNGGKIYLMPGVHKTGPLVIDKPGISIIGVGHPKPAIRWTHVPDRDAPLIDASRIKTS